MPLPDLHSAFDWFSQARCFTIFPKIPPTTRYPYTRILGRTRLFAYLGTCTNKQEVDGARQPVAFVARTLTDTEKKSSVYELECLAVVFALEKFRRYLEHAEFQLENDNQALSWLLAHPRQLGKIGRWVIKILSFKFRAQHVRGTQNVVADALSRMYHLPVSYTHLDVYKRQADC